MIPNSKKLFCVFFVLLFSSLLFSIFLSCQPERDDRNDGAGLPALGRGKSVTGQQWQEPDKDAGEDRLNVQEQHQESGRAEPSVTWSQGFKGHERRRSPQHATIAK